jgi:hypothetical protein
MIFLQPVMKRVPSGELFVRLRKSRPHFQPPKRRQPPLTAFFVTRPFFPVFSPLSGLHTQPPTHRNPQKKQLRPRKRPSGFSRHPKNKSLELSHSPVNSREK